MPPIANHGTRACRPRSGRSRARPPAGPPSSASRRRARRRRSRRRSRRAPPARASTGRHGGRSCRAAATGQVVLADVDVVGLGEHGEVGAVVDDERDAEAPGHLARLLEHARAARRPAAPSRGSGRCRRRRDRRLEEAVEVGPRAGDQVEPAIHLRPDGRRRACRRPRARCRRSGRARPARRSARRARTSRRDRAGRAATRPSRPARPPARGR